MKKIVYYVALSVDGYIARPGEELDGFVGEGSGLEKYFNDLKEFDTVIMGRRTYEFGYKFGLQPGQPAYANMKHYVFSNSLRFDNQHEDLFVCERSLEKIKELKNENGSDIYLCGGGMFAGWLLDNEMIDYLKIKLNPLVLGQGIRLFGNSTKEVRMELMSSEIHDGGLQIVDYRVRY